MSRADAERAVREGDLDGAIRHLQEQIRSLPADASLRVFLFQLLCVMGRWDRALTQLGVAGDLDASALAMVQMYREAVRCELLRAEVFSGKRSPLLFGEPDEWMALMVESLQATTDAKQVRSLRERAFEMAPASSGSIDGQPFGWIADADMRLGPICEAVINGRYYWLPFTRLRSIQFDPPTDLRDVVWMPARFHFTNGGDAVGVIPTRYSGSESSADPQVLLARKTIWNEVAPDVFVGLGQRMLATDSGEFPLMDVRSVVMESSAAMPTGDDA